MLPREKNDGHRLVKYYDEVVNPKPLVLIAKNGLGNRFRAMASGWSLAHTLGRNFEVLWEPFDGSATRPGDLFVEPEVFRFITPEEAGSRGIRSETIPAYLTDRPELLSLRGYDKGEQLFIAQFVDLAEAHPDRPAVIAAGNFFHPTAGSRSRGSSRLDRLTRSDRTRLLNTLRFRESIVQSAAKVRPSRDYLGLHLRGTDRRKEAASPERLIRTALATSRRKGVKEVFICSDDAELRSRAANELQRAGFDVFFDPFPPARRDVEGEQQAAADFINLMHASILVGPHASTFSTEAAVGGPPSKSRLLKRRTTGSARLDRMLLKRIGQSSAIW